MANDIIIVHPSTNTITSRHATLQQRANQLVIDSPDSLKAATQDLKEGKGLVKSIKGLFKTAKESANTAHKSICAIEKGFIQKVNDVSNIIEIKIDEYTAEARRLAAEKQKDLEAAAELAAKKEQLLYADELVKTGDLHGAREALNKPVMIDTPVMADPVGKIDGVYTRTTWKGEITSKRLFLKQVADGNIPLDAVDINQGWLNKMATEMNEAFNIPGAKAVKHEKTVVRTDDTGPEPEPEPKPKRKRGRPKKSSTAGAS